jgi:serpin B
MRIMFRGISIAAALILLLAGLSGCRLLDLLENNSCSVETTQSAKSRLASPQVPETDLGVLVAGNSSFAFDLYRAVRTEDGNLFYSPYSISLALAMTYAGARNQTEKQMAETLHFTLPQGRLHPAFDMLDLELASRGQEAGQSGKGFQLSLANSIWGRTGYSFLPDYLDVLAENYGAGMRLLDFQNAPEASRIRINNWVSCNTEGKIEDLLPQGAITPDTRLVLTNAIYFKAAWQSPFNKDSTHDDTFNRLDGSQISVPMMEQRGIFGYAGDNGYQAVELPYKGDEISMVLVLPPAGRFQAFENALDIKQVISIFSALQPKNAHVIIPRFAYASTFSLKDTLAGMGMPLAFSDRADFSGMNGTGDLKITDVFHKAFVTVDEAGTEAGAATGVIVGPTAIPGGEVEIRLDRPFIFMIRDLKTGTLLFIGRVLDPRA